MKQPLSSWHLPTPCDACADWIAPSTLADRSSPAPSRPTPHAALHTRNRDRAHNTKLEGRAMPVSRHDHSSMLIVSSSLPAGWPPTTC